jgi:small subunit ribosomal protein S17
MKQEKQKKETEVEKVSECSDIECPFHGELSARGRIFEGAVVRKHPRRIAIEFERTVFIKKYERYAKKKTRIHARMPDCMKNVEVGDYVRVQECRTLSKIIHFVLIEIVRKKVQKKLIGESKK